MLYWTCPDLSPLSQSRYGLVMDRVVRVVDYKKNSLCKSDQDPKTDRKSEFSFAHFPGEPQVKDSTKIFG